MNELVSASLQAVNNEWVPWALASIIVLVAVWAWLRGVVHPLEPLEADLSLADAKVRDFSRNADAESYALLDERMNATARLDRAWRRYRSTVREEQDGRLVSLIRPSDVFTSDEVLAATLNLPLVESVPNLLVGVGLACTFVGLIAALYFASQGVAAADVNQAKAALGDLLHAATFKFVTSLFGLACSIVFTFSERRRLKRVTERIDNFCHLLVEAIPYQAPAELAFGQLQESRKQSAELARFNTDLAASIASELSGRLQPELQDVRDQLIDALNGLAERLGGRMGEMTQGALERMLKDFTERLHADTRENVSALNSSISAMGGQVSEIASAVNDKLRGAVDSLGETISGLDTVIRVVSSEIGDGVRDLERVLSSLQTISHTLEATVNSLEKAAAPLGESTSALQDVSGLIRGLVDASRQSIEELSRTSSSVATTLASAVESIRTASGSVADSVRGAWETHSERFGGVDQQFGNFIVKMEEMIDAYRDRVSAFAEKLDAHLADGIGRLGTGINQLHNAIDQLSAALEDGTRSMERQSSALTEAALSVAKSNGRSEAALAQE